jgi:hypothetical protein
MIVASSRRKIVRGDELRRRIRGDVTVSVAVGCEAFLVPGKG